MSVTEFYSCAGAAKCALSPGGHGHNCYRTWEARTLESIPILEYHPLQKSCTGACQRRRSKPRIVFETLDDPAMNEENLNDSFMYGANSWRRSPRATTTALMSESLAPRASEQHRWRTSFSSAAASSGGNFPFRSLFAPQLREYRSRWMQEGFDLAKLKKRWR